MWILDPLYLFFSCISKCVALGKWPRFSGLWSCHRDTEYTCYHEQRFFVCVCLASAEPQLLKERKRESGEKVNTCNLSTWGVEARLGLQSQPQLHSEVKASWYYMRFYTTMTQKSKRGGGTNNQNTYFHPISVIAIFSQPPIPLWGFRCIPWPSSFIFR